MKSIDEIIVACFTGEASQEDLARLAEWRNAHPRNERDYRRRLDAWAVLGALLPSDEHRPAPPADLIVRRAEGAGALEQRREARDAPPSQRPSLGRVSWQHAALAASIILSLGVAAALLMWIEPEPFGPKTLVTGANEVATITLADETVVRLAPESRLEFFQGSEERQVSLTGSAYFAVSQMGGRPFRVRLPTGTVEVLGTRFEVQNRNRETRVAVVEGQVRVAAGGGRVEVEANEVARVTDRGDLEVEVVEDVFQVIDWLGRFLAFESTPLDQVAEEFQRRFGVEIEIVDNELRERTVTGWFSDLSPEEMIGGICTVVEAQCVIGDRRVRMERRSLGAALRGARSALPTP